MVSPFSEGLNLAKQPFPITLAWITHWANAFFRNDNLYTISTSYSKRSIIISQYHHNFEGADRELSTDRVHHMIRIFRDFLALEMAIQHRLASLESLLSFHTCPSTRSPLEAADGRTWAWKLALISAASLIRPSYHSIWNALERKVREPYNLTSVRQHLVH